MAAALADLLYYIILFLVFLFDVSWSEFFDLYLNSDLFITLASCIALTAMSLPLIMNKLKRLKVKVISCSLVVFGILQSVRLFTVKLNNTVLIIESFEILIYIAVGVLLFANEKNIKACYILLTALLIIGIILYRPFGVFIGASLFLTPFCFKANDVVTLMSLCFLLKSSYSSNDAEMSAHNIMIKADAVDFKQMLEFVERQYKSGAITEEEYKLKRAEIIKRL